MDERGFRAQAEEMTDEPDDAPTLAAAAGRVMWARGAGGAKESTVMYDVTGRDYTELARTAVSVLKNLLGDAETTGQPSLTMEIVPDIDEVGASQTPVRWRAEVTAVVPGVLGYRD